jgi:hypothetical protein
VANKKKGKEESKVKVKMDGPPKKGTSSKAIVQVDTAAGVAPVIKDTKAESGSKKTVKQQ